MNPMEILRLARKKKRLTIRDFRYWALEEMVHKDLLNKTYPRKGSGMGWPVYKISRRGQKALAKAQKKAFA